MREFYAAKVSLDLIRRVTDAALDEVREWMLRPLDALHQVVFDGATAFRGDSSGV